ncbi:hypothetical protein [Allosalinactinospora lopnorensis]|uniref:hypothetical protein n=1 Tax=Allosalinactinospora lopnorensis TaxID=1352348 RepID=UPI000623CFC4|nr:hypothetical protein [Allosalinactinospora lopnorensis]
MPDVHALPTPSIPEAWAGVDTSIDAETPELLSPEQLERYAATVAELLGAAGLNVETAAVQDDCAELRISNPRLGHGNTLELTIRDDRSAEWTLDAGDDLLEATPARTLAAPAARVLTGTTGG